MNPPRLSNGAIAGIVALIALVLAFVAIIVTNKSGGNPVITNAAASSTTPTTTTSTTTTTTTTTATATAPTGPGQTTVIQAPPTVTQTASASPSPGGTGPLPGDDSIVDHACDQNIAVQSSSTSCGFAANVFAQYALDVQQAGGPGSFLVTAISPANGNTYTDNCQYGTPGGSMVTCSHGSDAIEFPEGAAAVYNNAGGTPGGT